MQTETTLTIAPSRMEKVLRLSEASHLDTMDHATVLPWNEPIDKGIAPKNLDHLWITGTPFAEALTKANRLELAWLETARDISMFIWLEQTLPPLYMGYITRDHARIAPELQEYLMVFSKEEIVHTLTFKRFMAKAGLPLFQPPQGLYTLLTDTLPAMAPPVGVLFTLLLEWVAEMGAMHTTQGMDVEPMTRTLFRAHHHDEARHIAFGRWIAESYFETASAEEVEQVRAMARQIFPRLVDMYTYNPEIALHTSFDFPVQPDNPEAIEAVWRSEHNVRVNAERFSALYAWMDKLGLR